MAPNPTRPNAFKLTSDFQLNPLVALVVTAAAVPAFLRPVLEDPVGFLEGFLWLYSSSLEASWEFSLSSSGRGFFVVFLVSFDSSFVSCTSFLLLQFVNMT